MAASFIHSFSMAAEWILWLYLVVMLKKIVQGSSFFLAPTLPQGGGGRLPPTPSDTDDPLLDASMFHLKVYMSSIGPVL